MPHAYADVCCSCDYYQKYHCCSREDGGFLPQFTCNDFTISVLKRTQVGWLMGFNQLAGLYFDITCLKCRRERHIKYEAKTFGKKRKNEYHECCGKKLSFHFNWEH